MKQAPKYRHSPARQYASRLALALAVAILSIVGSAAAAALPAGNAAFQDVPQLEAIARSAGAQELAPITERQRFVVGPIEPHLQLPRCGTAVTPVIGSGHHMKDRVTVELRCAGPAPWHLYVPIRIIGTSPVVLAAHALVVGSVLKADDLRVEDRDVSALPVGYFDDPAVALGLTAERPIAGGAVITNQQLVAAKAVQRGQAVTLVADAGGMSVRMAGRALSDGLVNQRVKVQNLSSGKIVEGIARSEQVVEIIFQ